MDAPSGFGPLRRALLRGALFGIAFVPALFLIGLIVGRAPPALGVLVSGISAAFFVAALAAVELVAERRPASLLRDLSAAAIAIAIASIGLILAVLQAAYIGGLAQGHSFDAAIGSVHRALRDFGRHPFRMAAILLEFATPFAPLVFARLRRFRLLAQVPFTVVVGLVLGTPFHIVVAKEGAHMGAVFLILGFGSFLLPCACALADAVERWLARRLARGDE